MMHEFRLPSTLDSSYQPNKLFDERLPPTQQIVFGDNRIHGKFVGYSKKQIPWHKELPLILGSPVVQKLQHQTYSLRVKEDNPLSLALKLNQPSNFPFSNGEIPNNSFVFSAPEISGTTTTSSTIDATSILLNPEFQSPEHQFGGGFSITLPQDVRIGQDEQPGLKKKRKNIGSFEDSIQWESIRFPFTLEADFVMGFTALS